MVWLATVDVAAQALGVNAEGMLRVRPLSGAAERQLSGEEVSISPLHLSKTANRKDEL